MSFIVIIFNKKKYIYCLMLFKILYIDYSIFFLYLVR